MIADPRTEYRPAGRDTSVDAPGYQQVMHEAQRLQEATAQITAAFPDRSRPISIRMRTGVRLEVGFETALHTLLRGDCELLP